MTNDKTLKDFEYQPPRKVNGVRVDYLETTITKWLGKYWITLIPLDEQDNRMWEFCLDAGKLIKTQ